ncbi:hypothetical protein OQA88_10640 [Cercophora sp. LCS_1]
MPPYIYRPLDTTQDEIRVVDLLPSATRDAPIHLVISYVSFISPTNNSRKPPVLLDNIERTLPGKWGVSETLDGRFLYRQGPFTSWDHPTGHDFGEPEMWPPHGFRPRYEALSYTWREGDRDGDGEDMESACVLSGESDEDLEGVVVADGEHSSRVCVCGHDSLIITKNLARAIRYLRSDFLPRRMWIDAICINQRDVVERSHQVLRMRDIFRLAHRVLVWLGPPDDTSDEGMKVLERIGRQIEVGKDSFILPDPNREHDCRFWYDCESELPIALESWNAVSHLLSRSWFARVWVMQEVQLANIRSLVQCGETHISWHDFRKACVRIRNDDRLHFLSPKLDERAIRISELCWDLAVMPLSRLMLSTATRVCSDPRDKIYGILGIAPKRITRAIRPDYTLSVGDVYRTTFLQHSWTGRRLVLLDHCEIATKLFGVPSWVPNWQQSNVSMFQAECVETSASGTSTSRWACLSPKLLQVDGVRQGVITAVSPVLDTEADYLDFIRAVQLPGIHGQRQLGIFTYLYHCGKFQDHWSEASQCPLFEDARNSLSDFLRGVPGADRPESFYFKDHRLAADRGFKMIFATGGLTSIGTASAAPGDLLVVLPGCTLPKILRPTAATAPDGDIVHELVGSCITAGLMNAEGLLGQPPVGYEVVHVADRVARWHTHFRHRQTGRTLGPLEDPRLEPLPDEWTLRELNGRDDESNEGLPLYEFVNRNTGEVTRFDPRMTVEALRERGVGVESFTLC